MCVASKLDDIFSAYRDVEVVVVDREDVKEDNVGTTHLPSLPTFHANRPNWKRNI